MKMDPKKRRFKNHRPKPGNLSLIHEEEGEDCFSSSESGMISNSSHDHESSQSDDS